MGGHAERYAGGMTTQIAVKLPDDMLDALDRLVAQSRFESRSDAVRAGLAQVIEASRSEQIDAAIVAGFERFPETSSEMRRAHDLAIDSIDDEPWEKWW